MNTNRLTDLFINTQPYCEFYSVIQQDKQSNGKTDLYSKLVRDFFLEEATEEELSSVKVSDLLQELL